MIDIIEFLLWPFLACVTLIALHVYFGLHILRRGVIFADLALAQIAALGSAVAFASGFDLDGPVSYALSLGFALAGATLFAFTRDIERKVPQEAVIGVVYAVGAALAIVAVSHSPEGAEHIEFLLTGSILTVTPDIVGKLLVLSAAIGAAHFVFRRRFGSIAAPQASGGAILAKPSRWWEFVFYATLALLVSSAVKVCGVLMVFTFLVVPAMVGMVTASRALPRLLVGWLFALVGAALGLYLSFILDTPPGATIVSTLGVMLGIFGASVALKSALARRG